MKGQGEGWGKPGKGRVRENGREGGGRETGRIRESLTTGVDVP